MNTEFRAHIEALRTQAKPYPLIAAGLVGELDDDELDVIGLVVARLIQGRETYGPMKVLEDGRDFREERREKLVDGLIYDCILQLQRTGMSRPCGCTDAMAGAGGCNCADLDQQASRSAT